MRSASGNGSPSGPLLSAMVRNFSSVNGLAASPGRDWRNSAGAPSMNRTNNQVITQSGENRSNKVEAASTSNRRFTERAILFATLPLRRTRKSSSLRGYLTTAKNADTPTNGWDGNKVPSQSPDKM